MIGLRNAAIAFGFLLAGCGTEPFRSPYPGTPASEGVSAGREAIASNPGRDERIYLQRLYADTRLDPIRDKIPLQLRADAINHSYLRNTSRPTPKERQAIKAWLEVREKAQEHQAAVRGPPSALLTRARARVTQAISQLQSGKLTYAAFAQRIQQIDAQYQEDSRQRLGSSQ